MRAQRYLARKGALGGLETSQTVNARTTDLAKTVGNFSGDRRDLNIYIYIDIYIYIYTYIKLSTVALKIPNCSGKVRGACADLVSCFERA